MFCFKFNFVFNFRTVNDKQLNKLADNLNLKVDLTNSNQKPQDGLSSLPQGLNVDTSNVINKSTLDSYANWIREYNSFVN